MDDFHGFYLVLAKSLSRLKKLSSSTSLPTNVNRRIMDTTTTHQPPLNFFKPVLLLKMKLLKEDVKKNEGTSQSPILQAVHKKNVETLNTNIALGFDVNICCSNGFPALFEACESPEMLEVFLSQPNIQGVPKKIGFRNVA